MLISKVPVIYDSRESHIYQMLHNHTESLYRPQSVRSNVYVTPVNYYERSCQNNCFCLISHIYQEPKGSYHNAMWQHLEVGKDYPRNR